MRRVRDETEVGRRSRARGELRSRAMCHRRERNAGPRSRTKSAHLDIRGEHVVREEPHGVCLARLVRGSLSFARRDVRRECGRKRARCVRASSRSARTSVKVRRRRFCGKSAVPKKSNTRTQKVGNPPGANSLFESRPMGGHGGLNILPHKSWNPYGWKQRQRVALDEERAEAKAREEAGARARDAIETLRARKRGSETQSRASSAHVNLFAEEERALEEAAKRDAEAARTLDESHRLGGRARADAPWYAQRPKRNAKEAIDDASAEPAGRRRGRDGAGRTEPGSKRGPDDTTRAAETPPATKRRKKTIQELREERLRREKEERKRARAAVFG